MIKIGDIVKTKPKEGNDIVAAVVTKINVCQHYSKAELVSVEVLFSDGSHGCRSVNRFTNTGRHIDMQAVLDSIK